MADGLLRVPAPRCRAFRAWAVFLTLLLVPCAAADTFRAQAVTVRGRLLVDAELNGQGPYPFVVDAALRRPVVDLEVARDLGLPLAPLDAADADEAGAAWSAQLAQLAVGGLPEQAAPCVVMRLDALSARLGRHVAGLLPAHVPGYEVTLDFPGGVVTWRALDRATLQAPHGDVVPLRITGAGTPEVDVLLNESHLVPFGLSTTDAALCRVGRALFDRVGGAAGERLLVGGEGADAPDHVLARLRELRVGGTVVDAPVCVVSGNDGPALLGLGFLGRFEVTLNYEYGLASFSHPGAQRRFVDPPFAGAGVMLDRFDDGRWRLLVARPSPAATAGLRTGDRLVSVDGVDAASVSPATLEGYLNDRPGVGREVVAERGDAWFTVILYCRELL